MRALMIGSLFPPHDDGGGYELVWHAAVAAARAAGHEVRVLCTDRGGPAAGDASADVHRELRWYWHEHTYPRMTPWAVAALERANARTVRRHLDAFRPDVVAYWSMGGMSLATLEVVRRAGVPAVAFVHDDWLDYGPRVDLRTRWGLRVPGVPAPIRFGAAAHYAFVSATTRDHAWLAGAPLQRTSVASSGIDPSYVDPQPPRPWSWSLLYVGRIDARKGITTAIDALAELPEQATLTVAGGGPEWEVDAVRARARERGVEGRVRLLGGRTRAELLEQYDACDAVVFPVLWEEPWGLVPLEAMARGRPAIATGRGGSSEYLRDGENALLYPAGDASALAERVRRLAGDPDLRARLAEHGVATASKHTEHQFNAAVLEHLERAVQPAPAPVASDDDLVILVGDDVVPDAGLVQAHRDAHARLNDPKVAVQGVIRPGRARSSFAHWSARFRHPDVPLPRRGEASTALVDRSNLSLHRDALIETAGDLELGHHLLLSGVRLVVEPRAKATRPARPLDVAALARAERAFLAAHPHLASRLRARFAYAAAAGPARGRLRALVRFVPRRTPVLGRRVWATTTRHHEQRLAPAFLAALEEPAHDERDRS